MKNPILIGLIALLFFSCENEKANENSTSSTKPNVIFILADDLGYGDLGCYGQKEIKSPHLDQMASEGMKFTQHYAGNTVCAPSRCALMTGKHMGNARVRGNTNVQLAEEDLTVAEVFKSVGYKTAMFGKWGLGFNSESGDPHTQGFDEFMGYLNQVHAHNAYPDWIWDNNDTSKLPNQVVYMTEGYAKGYGGVATKKVVHTQDIFTKKSLDFIEKNKHNPFFLYIPYTLPHANNEANHFNKIGMETPKDMNYHNQEWDSLKHAYASAVTYLDQDVGKIIDKLKEVGIDSNTLIIFSSDNGPHAEGGYHPDIFNSSGGLRGYKRDLYEGGIREPMLARWPGKIKANTTSDHISAFYDFLPTICDLVTYNLKVETDGISYLPTLLGEEQQSHKPLYWEFHQWVKENNEWKNIVKMAMRDAKWKIVANSIKDDNFEVELYDLSVDPFEQNNVAKSNKKIAESLKEKMLNEHHYSPDFPIIIDKESNK